MNVILTIIIIAFIYILIGFFVDGLFLEDTDDICDEILNIILWPTMFILCIWLIVKNPFKFMRDLGQTMQRRMLKKEKKKDESHS